MSKRDFGMIPTNSLEILESPLTLLPGIEPVFSVNIAGTGTIDTPTMKLYKGSKDVSSTSLTGSMAISGRTIVCKKITALTPGDWVFYIYFNDGGNATERFCRFFVGKEGA
jgi:hypothetical protein